MKKSVPVPRRKYEKTSKKLKIFECQTRRRLDKTPICPTFFQFFWSLLTEGSSVRTRQGEPKKLTAFCGQFFYTAPVGFGQTTRRSIFVQQKAHEGVAALRNSTVRCFSDSNGHLPREFELDTGSQEKAKSKRLGFFNAIRLRE